MGQPRMTKRNRARADLFAAIQQLDETTRAQRIARANFNKCKARFALEELGALRGKR